MRPPPASQRNLFLTLLHHRSGNGINSLARIPVGIWMYWGDEYVPLRQVRRAQPMRLRYEPAPGRARQPHPGPLTVVDLRKLPVIGARAARGRLVWPGARRRVDRGRGPGGGLRHRRCGHARGHLRRGPAAPVPGQRAGHAQPGRHPDQPALQRGLDPRGAVPVLAAGPDRRPPGPGAHRRDPARRDRRIGHPRRAAARRPRLRPDGQPRSCCRSASGWPRPGPPATATRPPAPRRSRPRC